MENDELAKKFREVADSVSNRYQEDYCQYLGVDNPDNIRESPETDNPLTNHRAIDDFIGKRFLEIKELDNFVEACDYATSHFATIAKYHSWGEDLGYGIDKILLQFIQDLLGNQGWEFSYSETDFQEIFTPYEQDLLSETVQERTFVCLQGFDIEEDMEKIELSKNVEIRGMVEHDENIVVSSNSPESMFIESDQQLGRVSGPKIKYILETWFDVKKKTTLSDKVPDHISERRWNIRNALTALRLVDNSQTVNYARKYTESMGAWEKMLGGSGTVANQVSWFADYHLYQDDVEEICEVFKLLQSKDFQSIDSDIKMAVDRYNSATLRPDSEWRIEFSDMIIILEAILSKKRQIPERELAQKTAILLGNSHEERTEIYDDLRELYDKRSGIWGIAHGGGKKDIDDREALLNLARFYSSETLLTVLELERGFGGLGNLLKEMDEQVSERMLDIDFP